MEEMKYRAEDEAFHKGIESILNLGIEPKEFIHHFSCFTGHVNLARYLFFYECYKKVTDLCGHIADIGTWKGASFFYFAKLVKLFENECQTQVHGFDWFKGMEPEEGQDNQAYAGKYQAEYETVAELIRLKRLDNLAFIHKLDLISELGSFFREQQQIRFKLVFLDCGISSVLENSMAHFWPRLVNGGILILDHFNNTCSRNESEIIERYIDNRKVRQMPMARQPSAYVVK